MKNLGILETNTTHIMLDIETFGLKHNAAILSIGARAFDFHGYKDHNSFYKIISIESQPHRRIEAGTLNWWLAQDSKAQKEWQAATDKTTLESALLELVAYIMFVHNKEKIRFWCLGANFDFTILEDAYKQIKTPTPWKYSELCCLRSLRALVAPEVAAVTSDGIAHTALADVDYQILQAQTIINHLVG